MFSNNFTYNFKYKDSISGVGFTNCNKTNICINL